MGLTTLAKCDCCGETKEHAKLGYPNGWADVEIQQIKVAFCDRCCRVLRTDDKFFERPSMPATRKS